MKRMKEVDAVSGLLSGLIGCVVEEKEITTQHEVANDQPRDIVVSDPPAYGSGSDSPPAFSEESCVAPHAPFVPSSETPPAYDDAPPPPPPY